MVKSRKIVVPRYDKVDEYIVINLNDFLVNRNVIVVKTSKQILEDYGFL